MNLSITKFLLAALLLPVVVVSHAQKTPLETALLYLEQYHAKWALEKDDIADVAVSDLYQTQHNGVTHVYLAQRYQGIPIHNALNGIHITTDGKVAFATNRFISSIAGKINTTFPLLSPEQAIISAARHLQLPSKIAPTFVDKTERGEFVFEEKTISQSPIKVRLMYQPTPDDKLRLAWDLAIQDVETPDYWSVRVDALNGALLDKINWTLYCQFPHPHNDDCHTPQNLVLREEKMQQSDLLLVDGAQYNVFPVPVESPAHGERRMVINPADPVASPFGWHDTNGRPGPEFTITRGNNVHAFADRLGNNISAQDEPNGGSALKFDFPFDPTLEPSGYTNAATVQLFYMNNFMHDFTYRYGFDEVAGNFQQNNYNKGGVQGDPVIAQSQDASGNNNANFSTPPDGSNGVMQMFLWGVSGDNLLSVTEPQAIARRYETGTAGFGPSIGATPIIGQVVEARDGSNDPLKVCGPIVNASQVAGKIAMIDRGGCFFKEKTVNAERAGAIAVIICNFENNVIAMGNVGTVADPRIPTVMLSSSDCQLIRQYLSEGVTVRLQLTQSSGPSRLDGSLDNGIVAHEYGHGISIRLTGGPATSTCLSNAEQMGEGWSDFFTLVTTAQPNDVLRSRGIGTYVWNRDRNGRGFRRVPYSPDMSLNGQIYDDIIGAARPHGTGEVWAGVLWDLFWRFVDEYGWDDDMVNGSGGNNIAIQLVMDGMKFQSCSPGYIDGRDAILSADIVNNNGANQCLIWEVFARRGLGWSAEQNSPNNAYDGRAAFDLLPECVKELKIAKRATPIIQPGEEITYTLTVTNHKETPVSGVIVTDELPQGTAYIAGSAQGGGRVSIENGRVIFEIGDLAAGEERKITYRASTGSRRSLRLYYDDMERGFDNWINDAFKGADIWDSSTRLARSGTRSIFVPNTARENDQIAQLAEPLRVVGERPVLRFFHNYNTDPGLDGGIVQISNDNGASWRTLDRQFIRNSYYGRISYNTFAITNLRAFTGNSRGFIDSYIDLSEYLGQEVLVRFRFASLAEATGQTERAVGWAVDDFELMDLHNYQSEACVISNQGDRACAKAPEEGTIVESALPTSAEDIPAATLSMRLYPNPTNNVVYLAIAAAEAEEATVRILSADGKQLQLGRVGLVGREQILPLDISALASGLYFVEIKSGRAVVIEKLIVR